AQC
ncbi:putative transposase, partial [Vibrio cholerae HC-78A1]